MGPPPRAALGGLSPPIFDRLRGVALPAQPATFGGFRMGKRGPSPMVLDDLRKSRVSVYFSSRELAELDARRGGFGRGEWLRGAGLGTLPKTAPEVNLAAYRQLGRIAENLNQHQRAINEGRVVGSTALLDELLETVKKLRFELRGGVSESKN